jgi:hypothetical protein
VDPQHFGILVTGTILLLKNIEDNPIDIMINTLFFLSRWLGSVVDKAEIAHPTWDH